MKKTHIEEKCDVEPVIDQTSSFAIGEIDEFSEKKKLIHKLKSP